ncbi:hypothetical protein MNEG_11576 [Monoraphidium neglectum]|uniref:Lipid desaturase domain-containing protein n=1 Tax=Monoraphidium neglectum TaxID=145388 RepID=A0A0D2MNU9_9CHLO|nr:hypothetical protein MNEG_11576 [Monoraphidium neglectum]KIY96385.1 hypothetical protein MNEG_11576 [Monoraphidium neglectum]|eukprot:XP_013895405.1 hypothetical protein MNEG_11576 [Monoraphidium neglectum]
MTVLEEDEVEALERAAAAPAASTSGSAALEQQQQQQQHREQQQQQQQVAAGASKRVIDEGELLTSTFEHRLFTFGPMALMAASLATAASHVGSGGDALAAAGAVFAAYVLSDIGTGFYHWGVDNYGDSKTPFFGSQIAAFQGHHQKPWTITQREFCNNVFQPATGPAALLLAVSPFLPVGPGFFLPSFIFLACMSQQFHAWSHMKKSELPGVVVALQDAGILIGRRAHGAHHKPNFDGNYCIVSGWWNEPLDNSGVFRFLEKAIAARTGVEPRCWYPPQDDWEEQAQPQAAR